MKKLMCVTLALVAGVAMAKNMPVGQDPLATSARHNVWNLSFVQQSVDSTGKKVEKETLQGVLFVDKYNKQKVYVWDPKVKTDMINTYISPIYPGKAFKCPKVSTAEQISLTIKSNAIGRNTKLTASFGGERNGEKWYGVGTGSVDSKGYCKALAGNMLTYSGADKPATDAAGTWKASYDDKSTKIYAGYVDVKNPITKQPVSMADNEAYILATKGAATDPVTNW